MSSLDTVSHLLRVPKEIRLMIYRELLLPTKGPISMAPIVVEREEWTDVDSDEEEDSSDSSDSNSISAVDMDELLRGVLPIDIDESPRPSSWDESSGDGSMGDASGGDESSGDESMGDGWPYEFDKQDYAKYRRYPAILRTSRQIYSEASALLYTEATLVIQPSDIFDLASRPYSLDFGSPSEETWRYHPLKDRGQLSPSGEVVYSTTPNMDGYMLPHVFARFQKIHFDLLLDEEHTENVEMWIDEVDDTYVVRQEHADEFKATLRNSSFMRDFVSLISHSPLIAKLEISLHVVVMPGSNLMDIDSDDEDDDDAAMEIKEDRLEEAANERATELFLDSGVCDALLELNNVMTFNLGFDFERKVDEPQYQPLPQHLQLIATMKGKIEANFEVQGTAP